MLIYANFNPEPVISRHIRHNASEIIIDAFESSLLFGQRASSKNRLQIHPLALNLVQIHQIMVQIGQTRFPDVSLVFEDLIIRRVLEGLEKTLVVADGVDDVFPILDEEDVFPAAVLVVGRSEDSPCAPEVQLAQGLTDGHLALRALVQLLK